MGTTPMNANHKLRSGLSLTEVLVAFFILAIGVVSVIALFPAAISTCGMLRSTPSQPSQAFSRTT
jgi:Tfp pilus assembly protein PilV